MRRSRGTEGEEGRGRREEIAIGQKSGSGDSIVSRPSSLAEGDGPRGTMLCRNKVVPTFRIVWHDKPDSTMRRQCSSKYRRRKWPPVHEGLFAPHQHCQRITQGT